MIAYRHGHRPLHEYLRLHARRTPDKAAVVWYGRRISWAELGPEGEAKLAEQGVSVRCIVAADGSVPLTDDQEGNVAIVARAY